MDKKLNIAFVGQKGYPATYGGVEKVVQIMSEGLAKRGHRCTIYSRSYYSTPYPLPENIQRINIRGLRSKRLDTISHTFLSLMHCLIKNYDIVSIHSYGNALLNWIPRIRKQKTIVHLHGFEWSLDKWNTFDKILLRLPLLVMARYSDAITTVSLEQQEYLENKNIKCVYIPNGIKAIDRGMNTVLKIHNRKYILFVGRLVYQKGVEYLIKAFKELQQTDIDLLIVGAHNAAPDYFTMLQKLTNHARNIFFLGYKYGEELVSLFAHSLYVVIPSEVEANPIVLLEAISYNKCVVASDIPGIKNIGKDIPIYFKNKDYKDLLEKLELLNHNPKLIIEKEKLTKIHPIVEEFDWTKIIDTYEDLFQNVAK